MAITDPTRHDGVTAVPADLLAEGLVPIPSQLVDELRAAAVMQLVCACEEFEHSAPLDCDSRAAWEPLPKYIEQVREWLGHVDALGLLGDPAPAALAAPIVEVLATEAAIDLASRASGTADRVAEAAEAAEALPAYREFGQRGCELLVLSDLARQVREHGTVIA